MELCSKCAIVRHKFLKIIKLRASWNLHKNLFSTQPRTLTGEKHIWEPVIGLEIHAQINTESKLFSSARNQFMAPPNSLVSEFDAALPGTLPVLNKGCVEAAVLTALALKCQINHKSYFDRKHYFYADLPQGYQITQYTKPIAVNGHFPIPTTSQGSSVKWKEVRIEQIQLEQDSGKSLHDDKEKISLIDLNRAGVGLMEIVTSPDFRSAEEAATFVLDLQLTMQKLGTCAGKIAEGNLRVDANVSVHRPGEPLGTRSEVKNIAGISSLMQAINYEISRHKNLLESGEKIINETRDFVAEKGITVSMRDKEEFQDYRFMPEPNLPPLILYSDGSLPPSFDPKRQVNVNDVRRRLPEQLPADVRRELVRTYRLSIDNSSFLMENGLAEFFLSVMHAEPDLTTITVFHWLKIEILGLLYERDISIEDCPVRPQPLAQLLSLLEKEKLSNTYALIAFQHLCDCDGATLEEIIEKHDLKMITDISTIEDLCRKAIAAKDPEKLFKKYRRGEHSRSKNKKAVASIVTSVMELTNEKAHTKITQVVARDVLDECFVAFSKDEFLS